MNLSRLLHRKKKNTQNCLAADLESQVRAAAQGISYYPLTDEQTKAVAAGGKVTLVLAGAGTGKTANHRPAP